MNTIIQWRLWMLKWTFMILLIVTNGSYAQLFSKPGPIPAVLYDRNHQKALTPIQIYPFHYRKKVIHHNAKITGIVIYIKELTADMRSCKNRHHPLIIQFEEKNKHPEHCIINTPHKKCYLGNVYFDEIKQKPFQVKYYCSHY